ncbi:MAG: tetratricopeptide repeat protein, partial [Candidatus Promineifilaceae bacterium]
MINWTPLRKKLAKVMQEAFSVANLGRMLRYECHCQLESIVSLTRNKIEIVEAILNDAEAGQWMQVLIDGARAFNESSEPLKEIGEQVDRYLAEYGEQFPLQSVRQAASDARLDLDAALMLFDTLPTETIPALAPFRDGSPSKMMSSNPHFVGRQAELRRVARALTEPQGNVAIGQAVLGGMGGIGKTQLAVEFVHRYGQYFAGGVFWLNFAEAGAIGGEVAACGAAVVGVPNFEGLPEPQRRKLVQDAWQAEMPRLLVFDNLDDEDAVALLQAWRPSTGGCRVLVTSRRGRWPKGLGVAQVMLERLIEAESVTLLRELAERLTEAEAKQVAAALGYFPLALYLAGSYLDDAPYQTVAQFLYEFEQRKLAHTALHDGEVGFSPTRHDLSVAGTFALSWERLRPEQDQLAIWLLQHAACFAPNEPIKFDLLRLTLAARGDWPFDDEAEGAVTAALYRAGRRLVTLGLAVMMEDALRLHRLVSSYVRSGDDAAQVRVETVLLSQARQLNDAGYPAVLRGWFVHLRYVGITAEKRQDAVAGSLLNTIGFHRYQDGNYPEAIFAFERSLGISEKVLGAGHPSTASSLNNLAGLYESMGAYEKALPLYERSLGISEKVLGASHPDTGTSLNNLGSYYYHVGDFSKSARYFERALIIVEQMLGTNHPNTKTMRSNLEAAR